MLYPFITKVGILSVLVTGLAMIVYAEPGALQSPLEPAALDAAGIRALQQADPDLNGSGVVIAAVCRSITYLNDLPQNDYRFNMRHISLSDADVLFEDHSDGRHGISPHATAIAGILIGLDPQAAMADRTAFNYRGVSPYASVDVYEFWRFAALWLFAQKPIAANVITLSLGYNYEDWWTRGIEQLAAENGTVVVAAIGNGQAARDSALYPAAGANVIGVGVIDSASSEPGIFSLSDFAVPTARHSSQGPTADLRSKPDLVAPGTAIIPDAYSENGYTTITNASSLAAPMVAGTAALLLQKIAQDESLQAATTEAPVNCLIKAVLMNSARKLPYWHKGDITEEDDSSSPLDRLQGAGALDAMAAMAQLTAGRKAPGNTDPIGWDSRPIRPEETLFYMFEAAEPKTMLTATLTWNRYFEKQYPFRLRPEQSDLRLELWAVDPNDPAEMLLVDVSDSPVDTVEHLWTPISEHYKHYVIAVRFSPDVTLPMPDLERFALAWSVSRDSSADHPLWEDINGDCKVDAVDKLLQVLLTCVNENPDILQPLLGEETFGLSPERAVLLTSLWSRWKPYQTLQQPTAD